MPEKDAGQETNQELRKYFAAIIEQSPSTVVITDAEGRIEYTNPKFTALTGYEFEEVRGRNPRILKSGDQPVSFYKNLWDTIVSGKEWRGEFHNKRRNGEHYWEFASISAVYDAQGRLTHFIKVAEDTTLRKEAEENLKARNEELECTKKELEATNARLKELDQLKSDFISMVSHELRTPLGIIRQGVSLMQRKILGEINAQQSETLGAVLESVDRLVKIINDLLDISKLEAGKIAMERKPMDLREALRIVGEQFQIKAQEKKIAFKVEMPPFPVTVCADQGRMIQVLNNFVGNAFKFTPAQGQIVIGVKEAGDYYEISVADTGPGIAPENMGKLFNKFQQFGRTYGPGEKGTGLGLAISKGIVELHGGRCWATSQVDKGSTFYFSMPKRC